MRLFNLTGKDSEKSLKIIQGHTAPFVINLHYNNTAEYVPSRVQHISDNADLRGGRE